MFHLVRLRQLHLSALVAAVGALAVLAVAPRATVMAVLPQTVVVVLPGQELVQGTGVVGTPAVQEAGVSFNIGVFAVNGSFNLDTSVDSSVSITTTDPGDVEPGATSFASGVANFTLTPATTTATGWVVTPLSASGSMVSSSPYVVKSYRTVVVLPGQALQQGIGVAGNPLVQQAGLAFSAAVFAVDESFNIVTSRADLVGISTSDPQDTEPASKRLISGSAVFTVTPKVASPGWAITPLGGPGTQVQSALYVVNSGPAATTVIILPGQTLNPGVGVSGVPSLQIAGASFVITVAATDAFFNVNTGYAGTAVVTTTDPHDVDPGTVNLIGGAVQASIAPRTASVPGWRVDVTGSVGSPVASSPYAVRAGAAVMSVVVLPGETLVPGSGITGVSATQVVGVAFAATVAAVDSYFNTDQTVSVAVSISTSDPADQDPGPKSLLFGEAQVNIIPQTTTNVGWTVSVSGGPGGSSQSSPFLVNSFSTIVVLPGQSFTPGLGVSGTPLSQLAGAAFSVQVIVIDQGLQVVSGVNAPVRVSSSDPNDVEPAPTVFVSGQATLQINPRTTTTTGWTITPVEGVGQLNPSSSYLVGAGATASRVIILPGQSLIQGLNVVGVPFAQMLGVQFSATVAAVDSFFNIVASDLSLVTISTTDPADVDPGSVALANGAAVFAVTPQTLSSLGWLVQPGGGIVANVASAPYKVLSPQTVVILPGQTLVEGTGIVGTPNPQRVGTSFQATIFIVDPTFTRIRSASGTASIVTDDPSDLEPSPRSMTEGSAAFSITPRSSTAAGWVVTPSALGSAIASAPYVVSSLPADRTIVVLPGQSIVPGVGVVGAPTTQGAGTAFAIGVYAVDPFFNTDTAAAGAVTITTSDPNDIDPATVAMSGGYAQLTVVPRTATTSLAWQVTVSEGVGTLFPSSFYSVVAGSASQTVVVLPGQVLQAGLGVTGTPARQRVDNMFQVVVAAVDDSYNIVFTNFSSVTIGTEDPFDRHPIPFTLISGTVELEVTPRTATPVGWRVSPTSGPGQLRASTPYIVDAGPITQTAILLPGQLLFEGGGIAGTPLPQTAGVSFQIEALVTDKYFNIVRDASASVGISTADPNDVHPPAQPLAGGRATFSIDPRTRRSTGWTATAVANLGTNQASSPYFVAANQAVRTNVVLPGQNLVEGAGVVGSPSLASAGTAFSANVHVLDAFFNLVTVSSTVSVTTTDPNDTHPADVVLTNTASAQFAITPHLATLSGWQVFPSGGLGLNEPSAPYLVASGVPTRSVVVLPGQLLAPETGVVGTPLSQQQGVAFQLSVAAVDDYYNIATGATQTVRVLTTDPSDVEPVSAPLISGQRSFTIAPAVSSVTGWAAVASGGPGVNVPSSPYVVLPGTDADLDGVPDFLDNCPLIANPGQQNSDGGRVGLAGVDRTNPRSDRLGDACDDDKDNDFLADAQELSLTVRPGAVAPCEFVGGLSPSNPLNPDEDGDGVLSGIECLLGSNPLAASSTPERCDATDNDGDGFVDEGCPDLDSDGLPDGSEVMIAASASLADTDGDGIKDGVEVIAHGTLPDRGDTHSIGCSDGIRIKSLDGDAKVGLGDVIQIALAWNMRSTDAGWDHNKDINGDGRIGLGDVVLVALSWNTLGSTSCLEP